LIQLAKFSLFFFSLNIRVLLIYMHSEEFISTEERGNTTLIGPIQSYLI